MSEPVLSPPSLTAPRQLILVGNPNVGKSVLFMALTGRHVTVSNYPGTTVELTRANAVVAGNRREVIDTPGTNGLLPQSEDEAVTRDVLLEAVEADVLQVGDIKNGGSATLTLSKKQSMNCPAVRRTQVIPRSGDRNPRGRRDAPLLLRKTLRCLSAPPSRRGARSDPEAAH